jgi:hypothetical protein
MMQRMRHNWKRILLWVVVVDLVRVLIMWPWIDDYYRIMTGR